MFKAWRYINSGRPLYVEEIQRKGDRYAYTTNPEHALNMTESQCRAFCRYMRECDSVGFWG